MTSTLNHPYKGAVIRAMPSARALAYGRALLHGLAGSAASIAIAVFCILYFAWQFTR